MLYIFFVGTVVPLKCDLRGTVVPLKWGGVRGLRGTVVPLKRGLRRTGVRLNGKEVAVLGYLIQPLEGVSGGSLEATRTRPQRSLGAEFR